MGPPKPGNGCACEPPHSMPMGLNFTDIGLGSSSPSSEGSPFLKWPASGQAKAGTERPGCPFPKMLCKSTFKRAFHPMQPINPLGRLHALRSSALRLASAKLHLGWGGADRRAAADLQPELRHGTSWKMKQDSSSSACMHESWQQEFMQAGLIMGWAPAEHRLIPEHPPLPPPGPNKQDGESPREHLHAARHAERRG